SPPGAGGTRPCAPTITPTPHDRPRSQLRRTGRPHAQLRGAVVRQHRLAGAPSRGFQPEGRGAGRLGEDETSRGPGPAAGGPAAPFGDEGAANHTRLSADHGTPGVQLFVYGRSALNPARPAPARYPARQTLEASAAVARLHRLRDGWAVYAQQNPAAIDAGVFH